MTLRIHRSEPDQALLRPYMTSLTRERSEPPFTDEPSGATGWLVGAVALAVLGAMYAVAVGVGL